MPSKTIMIDIETYNKLKSIKKDKSFTEVINELLEQQSLMPLDLLGSLASKTNRIDYDKIKKGRKDRNVPL